VAVEEFCVFGDWGGSLNKPEKPERRGRFSQIARHMPCLPLLWKGQFGAPLALPNLPFKKIAQFVRQNAPACHITLIERFCFIEKSHIGFWTF